MKNLDIVDNTAAIQIDADSVESFAVLCGRSEPDLIVPHDGRRVAKIMYRSLPDNIFRFRPL